MARAVFRIEADTTAVTRAMGDLRGVARSAQAALTADARREAAQRDRIARDETRHRQRLELESLRAARDGARARTRVEVEGARERSRANDRASREEIARQNNTTRLLIAADKNRTAAHIAEEQNRTRVSLAESRRRATAAQREAAEVARASRARASRFANGVTTVAGAARGGLASLHGEIQSERRTRAVANRGLTHALEGAGIRGFGAQARQSISAFTERTGMNYSDVVAALQTGQQRGSALELRGRTPETALNDALNVVAQANATGTDAGALLAARGRIGGQGITGARLDELMRFVQFAADRGSVEVDQIIQQGLPGALRLMSSRTGAMAGATPEQRQAAAVRAFRESVAVQEVFAGTGMGPTRASNTFAALQSFMTTPRRQDLVRTNLRNYARSLNPNDPTAAAQRTAINDLLTGPNAIYEDDPTRRGQRRLRADIANNPMLLAERVTTAMGGNANAAANIFAGGGHGNAQAFLSNMRNAMEIMASTNPETGRMRTDAIRDIMGGGYTEQDIQRRRNEVEGDDLANINRAEESRAKALTDNTSALVRMSNSIDNFVRANPFAAQAAGTGGGIATGLFGNAAAGAAGGALGRAATTAAALSAGGGLAGAATNVAAAALGGAVGLGVGSLANQLIYSDRGNSNGRGPAYTDALGGDFWRGLTTSISQAFDTSIARGTLRATIDPVTAAHVTSQAANNPPPRTTR